MSDVYGQTVQIDDKHDTFVTFMATQEGPLRTAEYDKMICNSFWKAYLSIKSLITEHSPNHPAGVGPA